MKWYTVAGLLVASGLTLALVAPLVPANATATTQTSGSTVSTQSAPRCLETRIVGYSAKKRAIVACRQGTPGGTPALVIGTMHGNEKLGQQVIDKLRFWGLPQGLDLWTIRSMNPDGTTANTRTNARGVDLNRNFPYRWEASSRGGCCYSGSRWWSEPESLALGKFILSIRPYTVIVFHQALHVVDYPTVGDAWVTRSLARRSGIPARALTGYRGTLTGWTNAQRWRPTAVTFELGRTESPSQLSRITGAVVYVLNQRVKA